MLNPFILIAGGTALMAFLAKKSAQTALQVSIPNPKAKLAEYKDQLWKKNHNPLVSAEINKWPKAEIIKEATKQIPTIHLPTMIAIFHHETGGSFFPGTIAGYPVKLGNLNPKDVRPKSTAFGIGQVTKSTYYPDIATKTIQNYGPLPFRHEDLWYPPYAIHASYKTFLFKLKAAKGDLEYAVALYNGGPNKESYANAVLSLISGYSKYAVA